MQTDKTLKANTKNPEKAKGLLYFFMALFIILPIILFLFFGD